VQRAEILSPAGNMEKLKYNFRYGADACYVGGKAFNLRAQSHNFSKDDLAEAVAYTHAIGKRIYVALNVFAHDREIKALPAFVQYLNEIKVDSVIVADMGIFDAVKENSDLPIHISTQASVTNWRTARMWHTLGAKRIVLARELSLDEIKKIKDAVPDLELEVFVHGSMCMTYSGQCHLSSYMATRDGNRGMCTNSCRWKYAVVEETRPGQYFPIEEDETGTYMFNSRDLCTIEFVDKILDAGVSGLKIEGRTKGLMYGATTAKVYREAVDAYYAGTFTQNPLWREDLNAVAYRGYTDGFFFGQLKDPKPTDGRDLPPGQKELVAVVTERVGASEYLLNIRNRIVIGSDLEAVVPHGRQSPAKIESIRKFDAEGLVDFANPNQKVIVKLDLDLEPGDLLRQDIREGGLPDSRRQESQDLTL